MLHIMSTYQKYQLNIFILPNRGCGQNSGLNYPGGMLCFPTKKKAVIDLMIRDRSAKDIADDHGVTSVTLYNWKNDLPGSKRECIMNNKIETSTNDEINSEKMKARNRKLRKEVYHLQFEITL